MTWASGPRGARAHQRPHRACDRAAAFRGAAPRSPATRRAVVGDAGSSTVRARTRALPPSKRPRAAAAHVDAAIARAARRAPRTRARRRRSCSAALGGAARLRARARAACTRRGAAAAPTPPPPDVVDDVDEDDADGEARRRARARPGCSGASRPDEPTAPTARRRLAARCRARDVPGARGARRGRGARRRRGGAGAGRAPGAAPWSDGRAEHAHARSAIASAHHAAGDARRRVARGALGRGR